MTKFQIVLTYIKKYIFWVISGLCLIITFIIGTSITGSRQTDFKAQSDEIDKHFSEMQHLAGEDLPNEMVVDQKKKDVVNLKETIVDTWYQLYNPQVQYFENLWPDFRNAQGEVDAQATDYLEALQDTWRNQTVFDSMDEMPTEVKNAYRRYVTQIQEFDFMTRYKIYVPQTKLDGMEGAGVVAGMVNNQLQESVGTASVELPSEGMCTWDEANRQQMRRRFSILSRRIDNKTNTTRRVLLVQEDIWMYDILLGAISKMNEKSEGSHDAVVKRIFRIDIADDASTLNSSGGEDSPQRNMGRASVRENQGVNENDQNVVFNAEERVISVAEPQRTGNEELGEGDMPTEPTEDEEGSTGMADIEFEEIFDCRYCDTYGNFMSAANLAAYLQTKPEYIMMPVHVKILINQKKIPQFLLNCLNSEIPIYIHQISIQARDPDSIRHHLEIIPEEDSASGDGEGLESSPRQSKRSSREERNNDMEDTNLQEMENDSMFNQMNENGEIDRRKPEDVEFEMWGMICLFNKPDETKFEAVLGEGETSENEEGEEGEEGEENTDSEENTDEDAAIEEDSEAGEMTSEEEETDEETEGSSDENADDSAADDSAGQEETPSENAEN